MPHADERGYTYAASNKDAVALCGQEAIAEMTIRTIYGHRVIFFKEVESPRVVTGLFYSQFETGFQIVPACYRIGVSGVISSLLTTR